MKDSVKRMFTGRETNTLVRELNEQDQLIAKMGDTIASLSAIADRVPELEAEIEQLTMSRERPRKCTRRISN